LNIATFLALLLNEQSLPADEQSTEPGVPHELGLGWRNAIRAISIALREYIQSVIK
jgi:hypothetical protein